MTRLPKPAKILVVKLADIGDVLTATPALRALRQTYPQARIDLLLTHHTRPVMAHSTLVDQLIPSDNFRFFSPREALRPTLLAEVGRVFGRIRRPGYDTVLILHHLTTRAGALKYAAIARVSGARVVAGLDPGDGRGRFLTHTVPDQGFGAQHEIDYWLAVAGLLGATTTNREMVIEVDEASRAWAALMFDVTFGPPGRRPPLAILHPGSGGFSLARRWSPAHFAAVADALAAYGVQVILVGTASDGTAAVRTAMRSIPTDLTGGTSLHQLAALLHQADLFVGGDSGVTHLAAAAGIPLVAVFGPTNAAAWGPRGPDRYVLQAEIPCGPCAYVGHGVGLRTGCPARTCLKLVSPVQVLARAVALLAERGRLATEPSVALPEAVRAPAPPTAAYPQAQILGTRVHVLTFEQALTTLVEFITDGRPHQVVTVNPEFVVAAQNDLLFQRIINRAALSLADGVGILKAARWLGQPQPPQRIAGVAVVEALAALSARHGYRLYFLGAASGVAEQASAVLSERYPGMVVAGAFAGSPRAEDEELIVAEIQAARPDVIFVAYGAPWQDKWIARNMARLPAAVLIGVGGAFDFISGKTRRAPRWMQDLGLEWLHRFIRQPSRWRRMWNAVPLFLWLVWLARRE